MIHLAIILLLCLVLGLWWIRMDERHCALVILTCVALAFILVKADVPSWVDRMVDKLTAELDAEEVRW